MKTISRFDPSITFEDLQTGREGQFFDRKSARISAKDLANHICGFANADGGVIAVGFENNGSVSGLENKQDSENIFRKVPLDYLDPPPDHVIETVPFLSQEDGYRTILLMHIMPSMNRLIRRNDGTAYLRVGDSTRQLDHEAMTRLEYERGIRSFEEEVVEDASLDDLDSTLLAEYTQLTGSAPSSTLDLLRARGLLKMKAGKPLITNAGVLLFAKIPTQFLPQARVRFLRYDGTTEGLGAGMNIVKDVTIEKPLHRLLQEMEQLLSSQMREFQFLDRTGRFQRVPEYPVFSWLEGLVNAVAHRNYAIRGDYIRIKMFDDRIEFLSPGKLPNIVTISNIRHTRYSRNPLIARVLNDFSWVRELNEGVKRMYAEMESLFLDPPVFSEPGQTLSLVLRNNIAMRSTRKTEAILRLVKHERWNALDELERAIVILIANIENCTMKQLEQHTGKSRVTIQKRLLNLIPEVISEHRSSPNDPTKYYTLTGS